MMIAANIISMTILFAVPLLLLSLIHISEPTRH